MAVSAVARPAQITVKFFELEEEELLQRCLRDMPHRPEAAQVQPLDRVGFSGAKVFIFFPDKAATLPYVGKIHTCRGIIREIIGLRYAYSQFAEAKQETFKCLSRGKSMIALPFITSKPATDEPLVRELADMLFSWMPNPRDIDIFAYPEEMVIKAIDTVYRENCGVAMSEVHLATVALGHEYKWYLRECATESKLRTWLAASSGDPEFEFGGRTYPNPLLFVDRIRRHEVVLPTCTVHGDLHSSNVVMDSNNVPRLLDFTWCRKGKHVLKDFLVMECSVRFMMMPNHLGQAQQAELDELLLDPSEEAAEALLERFSLCGVDARTYASVQRCIKIVNCLRGHARRVCGHAFRIEDYWACQALVLYGLMRIDRYPFGRCARALGQLCSQLRKREYLG